ncbi:MAG: chemotaxis response regulator protein-glutamate methylesterase [Chloroflexi bacterium]|nr:MAG: chemotaxis response regulator protein-glutamate methylesterase [Chloroflexota bacterium]MBL1194857.1 chemotaxis response regulator protein-glutamate methylesterase [Chloroflexota bacterium]NOH12148.1 chemotaxis response regulator protein-glutamate methylesterase [Chloroflexota bacterium]
MIRVLVVDDSAFLRHMLESRLNEFDDIEVVGKAVNGREALAHLAELDPDVVTLDVEMPKMNGLEALKAIMAKTPKPVVMVSSTTTEGAANTIQALTIGAVDFIAKPEKLANVSGILDELAEKIRAASKSRINKLTRRPALKPVVKSKNVDKRPAQHVIVIGSSTGGPRALSAVLPAIPADIPAAVLIVQHMPPNFTAQLAQRLDKMSHLYIKEAEEGDTLLEGHALLAPGDFHMELDTSRQVQLGKGPNVHGVRPSVDVTMLSVVAHFQSQVLGAVLTGMGRDGCTGTSAIIEAGGWAMAQDEDTSVVWGMPRSVIEAGYAQAITPLDEVAPTLVQALLARTGESLGLSA